MVKFEPKREKKYSVKPRKKTNRLYIKRPNSDGAAIRRRDSQ